MALNITVDQLDIAQSYAAVGDYVGGWNYLSTVGDKYADNAYAVTSGQATGVDKGFEVLVKNHWENTAGAGAYEQKFDKVAKQHFEQYVLVIASNGGRLPDSRQIEKSYRDAVTDAELPPTVAIDGVITRSFGELMDKAWPGPKENGLDWTDALRMEDERQVPSDVFDDIDPSEAGRILLKDLFHTAADLAGEAAAGAWNDLKDLVSGAFIDYGFGGGGTGGGSGGSGGGGGGGIGDTISDFFDQARRWRPQSGDPLVLDLDGDDIETVAANGRVLFDHDGDGVKHGTGWVRSDDGFLVLDKNGNGRIDNGTELFGVDTVKTNGRKALDGFDALRDLDSNADGVFDANDTRFNDVRVWRDLNQDGVSQASELKTLAEHNIAAIALNPVAANTNFGNGNRLTHTALYTRTDGSTGTAANLIPAANAFYREYTDAIPLSAAAQTLPDMRGSGAVRDVREAASISSAAGAAFAAKLTEYQGATTRQAQLDMLDDLIRAWGATSDMKTSIDVNRIKARYHIWTGNIMPPPDFKWESDATTIEEFKANNPSLYELATTLERFNGSNILSSWVTAVGGSNTGESYWMPYSREQENLLKQSYAALKQSVYDSLITQTRLKPYLEVISLTLTSAGEIGLDFGGVQALYDANKAADARNALIDLVELQRYAGSALMGMGFNVGEIGLADMIAWRDDPEIKGLLVAANVRFDNATNGSPLHDGYFTDDTLIAHAAGSTLSAGGGRARTTSVAARGMTGFMVARETIFWRAGQGRMFIYSAVALVGITYGTRL